MSTPDDVNLAPLAGCGCCGHPLQVAADAAGHRHYLCACPDAAIPADELEAAVGDLVVEHLAARVAAQAVAATTVEAAWRQATPTMRRALITAQLAHVSVTGVDDRLLLAPLWHTERPAPPSAACRDQARRRS